MLVNIKAFNDTKFEVTVEGNSSTGSHSVKREVSGRESKRSRRSFVRAFVVVLVADVAPYVDNANVLQLKQAVAASANATPVEQQRLIFSGRVLKDTDTLESAGIKEGHTVHLVKSNMPTRPEAAAAAAQANAAAATAAAPAASPAAAAAAQANPFAGLFAVPPTGQAQQPLPANPFAGLFAMPPSQPVQQQQQQPNPFAALGGGAGVGGPGGMDPATILQMMQNPMMQAAMTQMMQDPSFVDMMTASNPTLAVWGGGLLDLFPHGITNYSQGMMTPEMRQLFSNPEYVRQMMNPQNLQTMVQMQQLFGQLQAAQGLTSPPQPAAATPTAGGAPNPMFNLFGGVPPAGAGFGGFGTGAPAATAAALPPPEVRFQVQLQQLQDMGFYDPQENINALLASGGNVNVAIERYVSASFLFCSDVLPILSLADCCLHRASKE